MFARPIPGEASSRTPGPLSRRVSSRNVGTRAEGPLLLLTLRDNGPGVREDASPGIGLANTRRRLEALYPGAHSLTLAPALEGGCEVHLRIPLETADAAAGPTPDSIRRAS